MWKPIVAGIVLALALACGDDSEDVPSATTTGTAQATLSTSPTPIDPGCPSPDVTPTLFPGTATASPVAPEEGEARIVGAGVQAHAQPDSASAVTRELGDGQTVTTGEVVAGENWIVGGQTFYVADQEWQDKWYRLSEGDYVYLAWVYVPREGETQPWAVGGGERSVEVDTASQTLTALVGDQQVFQTGITSGKAQTPTPAGSYAVHTRLQSETMESATPGDEYSVHNVLFTQYFSGSGHALHLNYWQPPSVFGNQATSHGCVGLRIHDAQWMWMFGQVGMRVTVR